MLRYLRCVNLALSNAVTQYGFAFTDELLINADGYESNGLLVAQSVWGILRGLETFSQVVIPINGYKVNLSYRLAVWFKLSDRSINNWYLFSSQFAAYLLWIFLDSRIVAY